MAKRSIYRCEIVIEDEQILKLPKGSEILSVIGNFDKAFLYAIVDTETEETEDCCLQLYGNDSIIRHDSSYKFLGTLVMLEGKFVCHVFYKKM